MRSSNETRPHCGCCIDLKHTDDFKSLDVALHDKLVKPPQYDAKSIYQEQMLREPISSYISMFLLSPNGLFNGLKGVEAVQSVNWKKT